jgi:hypothetical protein
MLDRENKVMLDRDFAVEYLFPPLRYGCHVRYFKTTDEGYHARGVNWGGDPTYWLEVNDRGDSERELQVYPNGYVLSYDRLHKQDEYGALGVMVIDGDEDWWASFEITMDEFEKQWSAHTPFNRGAEPGTPLDPTNQ